MKLISLNVEGRKHHERVKPFLERENADVLCIMEATKTLRPFLKQLGYSTTFAPMADKEDECNIYTKGLIFASKNTYDIEIFYYQHPEPELYPEDLSSRLIIFASGERFNIATTHFTVAYGDKGYSKHQALYMKKVLDFLADKPPHILCGDLNIPRNINPLYQDLLEKYQDRIPPKYKSSIDPDFHKCNNDPSKKFIFESYMVDHLLTQSPYSTENVNLEFGISDHAAIVTNVEINL